jgi:hypothetical protein
MIVGKGLWSIYTQRNRLRLVKAYLRRPRSSLTLCRTLGTVTCMLCSGSYNVQSSTTLEQHLRICTQYQSVRYNGKPRAILIRSKSPREIVEKSKRLCDDCHVCMLDNQSYLRNTFGRNIVPVSTHTVRERYAVVTPASRCILRASFSVCTHKQSTISCNTMCSHHEH